MFVTVIPNLLNLFLVYNFISFYILDGNVGNLFVGLFVCSNVKNSLKYFIILSFSAWDGI